MTQIRLHRAGEVEQASKSRRFFGWFVLAVFALLSTLAFSAAAGSILAGDTTNSGPVDWPLSEALIGQAALRGERPMSGDARQGLALDVLRHAPFSQTAVLALAGNAVEKGDQARAGRLVAKAQALGYRDVEAQKSLFNWHFTGDDAEAAMHHAEALLRQNAAEGDLYPVIDSLVSVQAFRSALVSRMEAGGRWAQRYLLHAAKSLPADRLASLALDLTAKQVTISNDALGPILYSLMASGRYDEAVRASGGASKIIPQFAALTPAARAANPFLWDITPPYRVDVGQRSAELVNGGFPSARPVVIVLRLPQGSWKVSPANPGVGAAGWLGSLVCGPELQAPQNEIADGLTIDVPATGCSVQALALARPNAEGHSSEARLSSLILKPLQH